MRGEEIWVLSGGVEGFGCSGIDGRSGVVLVLSSWEFVNFQL